MKSGGGSRMEALTSQSSPSQAQRRCWECWVWRGSYVGADECPWSYSGHVVSVVLFPPLTRSRVCSAGRAAMEWATACSAVRLWAGGAGLGCPPVWTATGPAARCGTGALNLKRRHPPPVEMPSGRWCRSAVSAFGRGVMAPPYSHGRRMAAE